MLGMAVVDAPFTVEEASAPDSRQARKRHRARHTKSRHGCFSCKLRRVKCDEARPVCGACASRQEPCSFPDPTVIAHRQTSSSRTPHEGTHTRSGRGLHNSQPFLEPLRIALTPSVGTPQSVNDDLLGMDNLLMIQFFHMYTAQEMSLHPIRSQVWRRVIPNLAGRNCYLMHLLLSLGGIHMITERLRHGPGGESDGLETVDLRVVMEHHQKGLKGFREEVAQISQSNAEAVYAGSLLLVGFIYASFQVPELNPPPIMTADSAFIPGQIPQTSNGPQLGWMRLIRGVSTVVEDQWPVLKCSRLRPMVLHFHGDEYWKDLPFASSMSRLSHCSPRLLVFARGANQAIVDLKAFWAASRVPSSTEPSFVGSPTSTYSSPTFDGAVDEQSRAMDILEMIYSRIISVLQCSVSQHGFPDDSDIQANFEEAAVLSWSMLIPNDFIGFLETDDQVDLIRGYSLVILAHFYVINTLVDRWFLNGSFKGEIYRIRESVCSLRNEQLDRLMMWPVKVATP
ncbi:Zn(II)2Cys6 transcription factor [Aspergillus alliaceus]|uniref:Zn(II)2Cys6 transcription factor n=1 Tax=Petromyces alliaceus TaxID=209559 RepID=UPI0012A4281F|nr:C6 zinc finger domain protein [Aspergillus alliaceus]KAB8236434.1 C6 zinc finger domain protein [Aspergillus alliaceus]